jgi:hypothetical protein
LGEEEGGSLQGLHARSPTSIAPLRSVEKSGATRG